MKRILCVTATVVALVLGASVTAQAAAPDAHSIITDKTGTDAVQVTTAQSVGGVTIGTGRDRAGHALDSCAQRTPTSVAMMATISDASQTKVDFALTLPIGAKVVDAVNGTLAVTREKPGPQAAAEVFGTIGAQCAA